MDSSFLNQQAILIGCHGHFVRGIKEIKSKNLENPQTIYSTTGIDCYSFVGDIASNFKNHLNMPVFLSFLSGRNHSKSMFPELGPALKVLDETFSEWAEWDEKDPCNRTTLVFVSNDIPVEAKKDIRDILLGFAEYDEGETVEETERYPEWYLHLRSPEERLAHMQSNDGTLSIPQTPDNFGFTIEHHNYSVETLFEVINDVLEYYDSNATILITGHDGRSVITSYQDMKEEKPFLSPTMSA